MVGRIEVIPMTRYQVDVVETDVRSITVDAESAQAAERIAEDLYWNSEIILDAEDFFDVEFIVSGEIND